MKQTNAMVRMNKTFPVIFLFVFLSNLLHGQESDFGLWTALKASYDFNKQLEAELSFGLRTAENVSVLDQYLGEFGLSYDFNDHFAAGASYRALGKLERDDSYHLRQKFYFHLKGTLPLGRFEFSGRIMYQKGYISYVEDAGDPLSENYARIKFRADYDSKSSPLKPFVSWEPFMPLTGDPEYRIEKSKYIAGTELKISGRSSIEINYIFDNKAKPTRADEHVILLVYGLEF